VPIAPSQGIDLDHFTPMCMDRPVTVPNPGSGSVIRPADYRPTMPNGRKRTIMDVTTGKHEHATTLRPYIRCSGCADRQSGDGKVGEHECPFIREDLSTSEPGATMAAPVGMLLGAISRLFDTYVLGPDRASKIASCVGIAANNTARGTRFTRVPDLELDLATLPPPRLRRLLDAFDTEIHYDCRQHHVRVAVRVSALLCPFPADANVGLVVPDGWPHLNPRAAHALLRLLIRVADSRLHRARSSA
jgi:hypothetical protein